jgi:hypothetical protein
MVAMFRSDVPLLVSKTIPLPPLEALLTIGENGDILYSFTLERVPSVQNRFFEHFWRHARVFFKHFCKITQILKIEQIRHFTYR